MIDNIGGMILMTSLLVGFGMPREFVLCADDPGHGGRACWSGDLIFTVDGVPPGPADRADAT